LRTLIPGADAWFPSKGSLQAHAEAQGRWPALSSSGTAQITALRGPALAVQRASARWSLSGMRADAPLSLELDAAGLEQAGRKVDTLEARLDGTLGAHRFTLHATSPVRPPQWTEALVTPVGSTGSMLALQLRGQWQPGAAGSGTWRGTVLELVGAPRTRPGTPWLAARDLQATLQLASEGRLEKAQLAPGRIAMFGGALRWQEAQWQATGSGPGHIVLDAEIEPLQVAPLLARLQPSFAWQGDLALAGHVKVDTGSTFDADVLVRRTGGDLTLSLQGARRTLGLSELRVALAAHRGQWEFTQALAGREVGLVRGTQTLRTGAADVWPSRDAPLQGNLDLRIDDLAVWAPWLPPGWRLGGRMQATASMAGRFGTPDMSGRVTGSALALRNIFEGVNLRDGELAIGMRGHEATIERAVFRGGSEGTLQVTGGASFATTPNIRLHVAADRFRALDRVDRRVALSGSADIATRGQRLGVDGRFTVDQGLIDVSQSDAPAIDNDVVVINVPGHRAVPRTEAPRSPPPGARTSADVRLTVDLGPQLRLHGRGLDTLLRGQLRITTTSQGQLAVNGMVRTVEGTYTAYGQNLAIERGLLAFTGDVGNPRLDILAVRPDLDTQRVGVIVSGPAVDPRIRLYSEPSLPEFDTLTWLVLGRAPAGLGRDDTALLQRAALALLAGEHGADGGIVKRLGLDELSFRRADSGNVADTVVSLGKQVSKRLYVGYERALAAAGGSLQLVYRVAGRLTLRLQAGDENALDMIWTWRWD
ncbi:MAG TPA: translocation/assembly module TamB domain-containing protein, partial [Burkholderiaceae bacterium]|nr:translocation/assembly module TamB domain-containing protein [Burkholderiaceae bacterium]